MRAAGPVVLFISIGIVAPGVAQFAEPWQTDWQTFAAQITPRLTELAPSLDNPDDFVAVSITPHGLPGFEDMPFEWEGSLEEVRGSGRASIRMNRIQIDHSGSTSPGVLAVVFATSRDSNEFEGLAPGIAVRYRGRLSAIPLQATSIRRVQVIFNILVTDVELLGSGDFEPRPTIADDGIVLATLSPPIAILSPNSIATAFGQRFTTEGVSALNPEVDAQGTVTNNLAASCVEVNGERSNMFAVLANQVNFLVPGTASLGPANITFIRGCGTDEEVRSNIGSVMIQKVTPAFFTFTVREQNGPRPIAALHGGGPELVGAPGILGEQATTRPAVAGEHLSLFAAGLGPVEFYSVGEVPQLVNPDRPTAPLVSRDVRIFIDGIEIARNDISYVGVAPCCAGLYQIVVRVPSSARAADLPVVIVVDGVSSPEGPFITVAE